MKTVYDVINEENLEHNFSKAGLVVEIPYYKKNAFFKLIDSLIPQLEPLQNQELLKLFTSKGFSDDLRIMHSITGFGSEDEAILKVIRWAHPHTFYGMGVKKVGDEEACVLEYSLCKDRYLFLHLHSHPFGTGVRPSSTDLRILNRITLEMLTDYKIISYEFDNDFDPRNFRPIMGMANYKDLLGKNLELLLLQCRRDFKEEELNDERIQEFSSMDFYNNGMLIDALNSYFPYNVALLNYRFKADSPEEIYILNDEDVKKLVNFV